MFTGNYYEEGIDTYGDEEVYALRYIKDPTPIQELQQDVAHKVWEKFRMTDTNQLTSSDIQEKINEEYQKIIGNDPVRLYNLARYYSEIEGNDFFDRYCVVSSAAPVPEDELKDFHNWVYAPLTELPLEPKDYERYDFTRPSQYSEERYEEETALTMASGIPECEQDFDSKCGQNLLYVDRSNIEPEQPRLLDVPTMYDSTASAYYSMMNEEDEETRYKMELIAEAQPTLPDPDDFITTWQLGN